MATASGNQLSIHTTIPLIKRKSSGRLKRGGGGSLVLRSAPGNVVDNSELSVHRPTSTRHVAINIDEQNSNNTETIIGILDRREAGIMVRKEDASVLWQNREILRTEHPYALPAFNLGMIKTGTTSLDRAMQLMGLNPCKWQPKPNNFSLLRDMVILGPFHFRRVSGQRLITRIAP